VRNLTDELGDLIKNPIRHAAATSRR
jgi:hypothetical protein